MKIRHPFLCLWVCLTLVALSLSALLCCLPQYGPHSLEGKYAIYGSFLLQLSGLWIDKYTNRGYLGMKKPYTPSKKMRRFRRSSVLAWIAGSVSLALSLTLILWGLPMEDALPKYLCIFGMALCPLGWVGLLMSSHRRRQALLMRNPE